MQNVIKEEPVEFVLILPSFECKTEQATKFQPTQSQIRGKSGKLEEATRHSEIRRYQCSSCSKSYKAQWQLNRHRKIHKADDDKFHCDLCEYKSCYKKHITRHMTRHTTDYNYKCPDCFKFFKAPRAVKVHQKLAHLERKVFKCSNCEVTTSTISNMRYHERTVHSTRRVKCQLCGLELKHLRTLKQHMKNKHGGDKIKEKRFQCDVCGAFKSLKTDMKLHLSQHFDSLKVKCEFCEKTYRNQQALRRHLSIHRNEIFYCQLCSKAFKIIDSLRKHQKIHSDVNYPCSLCQQIFKTKPSRIAHEARMHYNGEKLQCPKCKKQLKNPEALKEHLRAHSTVIKFECQICGSKFPRKSSFDSHNLNVHGSIRIWNAKNVSNRSMRQD